MNEPNGKENKIKPPPPEIYIQILTTNVAINIPAPNR